MDFSKNAKHTCGTENPEEGWECSLTGLISDMDTLRRAYKNGDYDYDRCTGMYEDLLKTELNYLGQLYENAKTVKKARVVKKFKTCADLSKRSCKTRLDCLYDRGTKACQNRKK